jgi:hypothetical protein
LGRNGGQPGTLFYGSPVITIAQQPYDRFAFAGEAVAFWVEVAGGAGTLDYQWFHNDELVAEDPIDPNRIDGQDTWLLVISPVVVADGGTYHVVISDDCGYAISEPAVLIVPPPGDMNCDGAVDFGDINPFVLALTSPAAYTNEFPYCDIMLADCNTDGTVDFGDINPFIALLTGSP